MIDYATRWLALFTAPQWQFFSVFVFLVPSTGQFSGVVGQHAIGQVESQDDSLSCIAIQGKYDWNCLA